jgi:hypothetical protein
VCPKAQSTLPLIDHPQVQGTKHCPCDLAPKCIPTASSFTVIQRPVHVGI